MEPRPYLHSYSQFTLVSHFHASYFKWHETVKCDSSVNWNIAVVRQNFEAAIFFGTPENAIVEAVYYCE